MIIDYDFRGKRVTIVGGGRETARKIRSFVDSGARVRLLGPHFDGDAIRAAKRLHVPVVRCSESQIERRAFVASDVVVVVADSRTLGRRLRPIAKHRRVLFYAGDDPEVSDWTQPAVRFAPPISIAVSTTGESPIVARTLAERLIRQVRPADRLAVAAQSYARERARRRGLESAHRREVLYRILEDRRVRAALAKRNLRAAKVRAERMISDEIRGVTVPK